MKHTKLLYGFIVILGIIFLAVFLPLPMFRGPIFFWFGLTIFFNAAMDGLIVCFFSIVGAVFLTAGTCGIANPYLKNNQKLSNLRLKLAGKFTEKYYRLLFGLIAALGAIFLTIFFTGYYWNSIGVRNFLTLLPSTQIGLNFILFCLFGGTTILTIGNCGLLRHYFKNHRSLFTILVAISIPSFILMPLFYVYFSALTVGF